ncbi:hypothetical protein HPB50_021204 [Hyalomma asiaticum]|uniref:Uncharacterized protein n=1 Tax=Hyalomma asiaticum TaxID=266040 RepID=A0ACB7RZ05_HYAAI|nr:hypothetical protein HPB50_021204 [Hyalomma asiaticum]
MASAALAALSPPPPFLATPGTPAIPWPRWIRLFENFLLASGATGLPAPYRRALLPHCLGPEGQCIFDALPPPPIAPQLPTTETLTTDTTSTGASKDRGGVTKQDASATRLAQASQFLGQSERPAGLPNRHRRAGFEHRGACLRDNERLPFSTSQDLFVACYCRGTRIYAHGSLLRAWSGLRSTVRRASAARSSPGAEETQGATDNGGYCLPSGGSPTRPMTSAAAASLPRRTST